jgi:hypothetical protein
MPDKGPPSPVILSLMTTFCDREFYLRNAAAANPWISRQFTKKAHEIKTGAPSINEEMHFLN